MARITMLCGHYGSGKSEIAVSLAMRLAQSGRDGYPRLALVDLDVANPYFRSRERRRLLEDAGVKVYADLYDSEITAELPALNAAIRAPLEDENCRLIIDLGGNAGGARVMGQFEDTLPHGEYTLCCVQNFLRPDTAAQEGAVEELKKIQYALRLKVTHLISNTHLLMETTPEIVLDGYKKCRMLSEHLGLPIQYVCYPEKLISEDELQKIPRDTLLPLKLYLRESYLDK